MNQPQKPVCKHCGSDNLCIDAAARWDIGAQDWTLASVHDEMTCEDCGNDSHSASWEPVAVAPVVQPEAKQVRAEFGPAFYRFDLPLATVAKLAAQLMAGSVWFAFEPIPDGRVWLYVKHEESARQYVQSHLLGI